MEFRGFPTGLSAPTEVPRVTMSGACASEGEAPAPTGGAGDRRGGWAGRAGRRRDFSPCCRDPCAARRGPAHPPASPPLGLLPKEVLVSPQVRSAGWC